MKIHTWTCYIDLCPKMFCSMEQKNGCERSEAIPELWVKKGVEHFTDKSISILKWNFSRLKARTHMGRVAQVRIEQDLSEMFNVPKGCSMGEVTILCINFRCPAGGLTLECDPASAHDPKKHKLSTSILISVRSQKEPFCCRLFWDMVHQ